MSIVALINLVLSLLNKFVDWGTRTKVFKEDESIKLIRKDDEQKKLAYIDIILTSAGKREFNNENFYSSTMF